MRHIFFRIVFAAAAILLSTSVAFACSCISKRTVLDEYESVSVVMIARVASIKRIPKADRTDEDYIGGSSRLVVEKVYKGDVRVGEELMFAQGDGGDCLMTFSEQNIGYRLLIYQSRPSAGRLWGVSVCGRSAVVDRATEDLLYLDKMDQVQGKTRVSGKYGKSFYAKDVNVAGRKIRIVSDANAYETTTDENGIFEIYDLPPGNYRLEPEIQSGLIIDRRRLRSSSDVLFDQSTDTYLAFTLNPKKHVSIEFGFKPKDQK